MDKKVKHEIYFGFFIDLMGGRYEGRWSIMGFWRIDDGDERLSE